mmetsp:Transcript_13033/g.28757  ORF Transcript_13033/g.28757 Transcript_13033/m.28757 type:complete len:292 (+) Transcript_13033:846-1721(+)
MMSHMTTTSMQTTRKRTLPPTAAWTLSILWKKDFCARLPFWTWDPSLAPPPPKARVPVTSTIWWPPSLSPPTGRCDIPGPMPNCPARLVRSCSRAVMRTLRNSAAPVTCRACAAGERSPPSCALRPGTSSWRRNTGAACGMTSPASWRIWKKRCAGTSKRSPRSPRNQRTSHVVARRRKLILRIPVFHHALVRRRKRLPKTPAFLRAVERGTKWPLKTAAPPHALLAPSLGTPPSLPTRTSCLPPSVLTCTLRVSQCRAPLSLPTVPCVPSMFVPCSNSEMPWRPPTVLRW